MQPKYCNVAATVGSQQFAINLQHTHTYTYFHCVCMYEARCMRRNLGCEHSRKKVVQKNTKAPFFFFCNFLISLFIRRFVAQTFICFLICPAQYLN